ncbi:MAG: pseudouridine synthase [Candidatus Nanopelagicales bacterium]
MATEGIRLQKVLASAGIGSRRACEELIAQGRVTVDGKVVSIQGMRVDPDLAEIRVDGDLINFSDEKTWLMLNKPVGVLSTMHDEMHRPCVGDYLADRSDRLFHVGRLDADTEGLLLLTNDGQLANRLTHPAFGVSKRYLLKIQAPVPKDMGKRLKQGIMLDDGLARFDDFKVVDSTKNEAIIEVAIHEGRNRIVRRAFEEMGFPIRSLIRIAVGPIELKDLKSGQMRRLTSQEIAALKSVTGE